MSAPLLCALSLLIVPSTPPFQVSSTLLLSHLSLQPILISGESYQVKTSAALFYLQGLYILWESKFLFPGDKTPDPIGRDGAGRELLWYDMVQRANLELEGQGSSPGSATNSNCDLGQVAFLCP